MIRALPGETYQMETAPVVEPIHNAHTPTPPQPRLPAECPVEHWLAPLRHGELARRLPGVSAKVLGERLAELAAARLVQRHDDNAGDAPALYGLSDAGRRLKQVLDQLEAWSASLDNTPPPRLDRLLLER
jgi:DNA-binding HxlR family transcriptional regulator